MSLVRCRLRFSAPTLHSPNTSGAIHAPGGGSLSTCSQGGPLTPSMVCPPDHLRDARGSCCWRVLPHRQQMARGLALAAALTSREAARKAGALWCRWFPISYRAHFATLVHDYTPPCVIMQPQPVYLGFSSWATVGRLAISFGVVCVSRALP